MIWKKQPIENQIASLNSNFQTLDTKLTFSSTTNLHIIQDSGHNMLILRGGYEGTNNYLQLICNGSTKTLSIVKSVNGNETTLATFSGA